jgi:predicted negative regulator of RcsB-dependent stress response
MFGLSFTKVIVLVLVISVVWFGFRWFQRWEKEQSARNAAEPARKRDRAGTPRELAAEDMVACAVCGAYVSPRSATSCGKPGCPYPR